jgi:acetyl-CoA C-acetyltransferase
LEVSVADALIIDGVRTPRGLGKPSGALHELHPQQLMAQVLNFLAERLDLPLDLVDDVILGNGTNDGDHGQNIARMSVLAAGWPTEVPGTTVNRFCGSGQQAIMFAAAGIGSGSQDLVVGGGVESVSRWLTSGAALGAGNRHLRERYPMVHQGVAADLIATLEGFTRTDVDEFAVLSQQRAADAMSSGAFARSLIPVHGDSGEIVLAVDEHPRPGTTLSALASLPPSFAALGGSADPDAGCTQDEACLDIYPEARSVQHVHHAGNSSGRVDGAAAVVLASRQFANDHELHARARVVASALAGTEPVIMLTAPTPASRRCLQKAGMTVDDIDLWEINEAFAAIPLKTMRDLGIDPSKVNVNGGAIALGHPVGATGAILVQTALDELERRDLSTALITMCTGGGMGTATIIERV